MSGMTDLKSKMKCKVKLDDLSEPVQNESEKRSHGDKGISQHITLSANHRSDMSPNQQKNKSVKPQITKSRMTVYLDENSERLFNEIYAKNILNGEKEDKSSLICEAIELLYKKRKGW